MTTAREPGAAGIELQAGLRVSLDLADDGACVAVIRSERSGTVELELLDEIPRTALGKGSTVDVFLPREGGLYRIPTRVDSAPSGNRLRITPTSTPLFIQRRLDVRVRVELRGKTRKTSTLERGAWHNVHVDDLSRGGAKLTDVGSMSTGDSIELSLPLDGGALEVKGRVVMAYGPGGGFDVRMAHIAFTEMKPESLSRLERFLAAAGDPGSV